MSAGRWRDGLAVLRELESRFPFTRRSTVARAVEGLARAGKVEHMAAVLSQAWRRAAALQREQDRAVAMPDERMCAMAANAAVDRKRIDLATDIIKEMVGNGVPAGPYSFSVLIKGYGREGRANAVESLLVAMAERKVPRDVVVYNSAIDAFVRSGLMDKALDTIEAMKKDNCPPNTRTYNTILKGLVAQGDLARGFELRREMAAMGVEPNSVTRNTLVDGCVRLGQFDDARKLVDEISARLVEEPDSIFAYTSIVHGLAMQGRLDEAFEYVNELERAGVPANVVTYTALVSAYIHVGEVAKAWFLFRGMRRVNLDPDSGTFTVMISGLARRGDARSVDAAKGLYDEMRTLGLEMPEETYNSMMDGYVRIGDMEGAERIFRELEGSTTPTVVSFTTLLHGYGRAKDMVAAKSIFRQMRVRGIKPDRVALNTFLSACIRCGDMTLAYRVFEEMQRTGGSVAPNVVTYGALILGQATDNNPEEAWKLFEDMKEAGIAPSKLLLSRLFTACIRGLLPIETGIEIIRDMVSIGCTKEEVEKRKRELRPLLAVASEVWKEVDGIRVQQTASEQIFEKHGWNKMDSGFRAI